MSGYEAGESTPASFYLYTIKLFFTLKNRKKGVSYHIECKSLSQEINFKNLQFIENIKDPGGGI